MHKVGFNKTLLIMFHDFFFEKRHVLSEFSTCQLLYSVQKTAYHNIFFVFSSFLKCMENHQNHKRVKLNIREPDIEKNHCHRHKQQQQHCNKVWGTRRSCCQHVSLTTMASRIATRSPWRSSRAPHASSPPHATMSKNFMILVVMVVLNLFL